jgi:hypothetical protein
VESEKELFMHELQLVVRDNYMNSFEDDITLTIRPRPTENVSVKIPTDTLQSLTGIAATGTIKGS